jgi:hypothetical protein
MLKNASLKSRDYENFFLKDEKAKNTCPDRKISRKCVLKSGQQHSKILKNLRNSFFISPKHTILQLAKKNMAGNAPSHVFRCFNDFLNAFHTLKSTEVKIIIVKTHFNVIIFLRKLSTTRLKRLRIVT